MKPRPWHTHLRGKRAPAVWIHTGVEVRVKYTPEMNWRMMKGAVATVGAARPERISPPTSSPKTDRRSCPAR